MSRLNRALRECVDSALPSRTRGQLDRDANGRPNTNVGLLLPASVLREERAATEGGGGHTKKNSNTGSVCGGRWGGARGGARRSAVAVRAMPRKPAGRLTGGGGGVSRSGGGVEGREDEERDGGGGGGGDEVTPEAGWFWLRSHMLSFLLRQLPHRVAHVRHLKARLGTHFTCFTGTNVQILTQTALLGFPSRGAGGGHAGHAGSARGAEVEVEVGGVIGVHIRRGDACAASVGYRTPCQPLAAYVDAVLVLARTYRTSQVLYGKRLVALRPHAVVAEGLRALHSLIIHAGRPGAQALRSVSNFKAAYSSS